MAVMHEFAIISKDDTHRIISDEMKSVKISEVLIGYINDSLQWIFSTWNDDKNKSGISYYGYSIIEGEEIEKFKIIIMQWEALFRLATEDVCLKGDFLLDEGKYEKNILKKPVIINELHSLVELCMEAIENECIILHNGI